VAEGVGWDIFALLVAVPGLLASLPAVARGSLRGRLFALGVLAYLFYQYLMYSVTWAFGPLFLLFVGIYALCLTTAVLMISSTPLASIREKVRGSFPRRGMSIFATAATLSGGLAVRMYKSFLPS
jgi:hypothetical protein